MIADELKQQELNDLQDAREILASLKKAYKEHAAGRATTKRYKIKDREMEFTDLSDLLKQIQFWEKEVVRLAAATGISPHRPRRFMTRFI